MLHCCLMSEWKGPSPHPRNHQSSLACNYLCKRLSKFSVTSLIVCAQFKFRTCGRVSGSSDASSGARCQNTCSGSTEISNCWSAGRHVIASWSYFCFSEPLPCTAALKHSYDTLNHVHHILVSWIMTPCALVGGYQHFGGTLCLCFSPKMEAKCSTKTILASHNPTRCHKPDHNMITQLHVIYRLRPNVKRRPYIGRYNITKKQLDGPKNWQNRIEQDFTFIITFCESLLVCVKMILI